jgi:RimJ/RimL family protein N-acetyltransferase
MRTESRRVRKYEATVKANQRYAIGSETRRLHHRACKVDDAEVFFALNSNEDVMRFTGEPLLASMEAARQAIADQPGFDEIRFGRWASVLKETQTVIGFCGSKRSFDLDSAT